jgi:hypothetical protein
LSGFIQIRRKVSRDVVGTTDILFIGSIQVGGFIRLFGGTVPMLVILSTVIHDRVFKNEVLQGLIGV